MKLRLHRLFSQPEVFTPVHFHSGINLILGEKGQGSTPLEKKVNSVGKSLCVEFLQFALLANLRDSRVARVPPEVLSPDTTISLELSINDTRLQISRSLARPDEPVITVDGQSQSFASLSEALRYLEALLYRDLPADEGPSLRSLLSVLMRDERSKFTSVLSVLPADVKAMPDITPHLFLMGFETSDYRSVAQAAKAQDKQDKIVRALNSEATDGGRLTRSEVGARMNQEQAEVAAIEEGLKALQAEPAYELLEKDIITLETQLADLRAKRRAGSFQLDRIEAMPQPEFIDETDVAIVYNQAKNGLGDLVVRSLEQARLFKKQIETFQRSLLQEEATRLRTEQTLLNQSIAQLADQHAAIMRQLDQKGTLQELRLGLNQAVAKQERYHRRSHLLDQLQQEENTLAQRKSERSQALLALRLYLTQAKAIETEIGQTIASIHERIMGSRLAFFRLVLKDSAPKNPVTVDLETQGDGGHSVERTKVFIYDTALLFAPCTQSHHPGLLLHDNLFDVDQDTMVQCLNSLHERQAAGADFQYVLTLNREKIETEERLQLLKLDVDALRVATLTRSAPFLRQRYQEQRKRGAASAEDDPQTSDAELFPSAPPGELE